MRDVETTCNLDEYLKLISDSSKWEDSDRIDQFRYIDDENFDFITVKVTSEVIDFLQPYKDDIVNMAMADEVVVCHGFQLDTELTPEEEFKGCRLPQSLWDLKEKYSCCIEFIHALVYDACKEVQEIGGIHVTCEDDSFADPYFVWTASKDIAVREIYLSDVLAGIDSIWEYDIDDCLNRLNYMETYVYNVFDDELSREWVEYALNFNLLREYYLASKYFHIYDDKEFDEKIELLKKSFVKVIFMGCNEESDLIHYYKVVDLITKDIKEYLLEGKEIKLTRKEGQVNYGEWLGEEKETILEPYYEFEGNPWLKLLAKYCDLDNSSILYKAFLDYILADKRFGVREVIENDRHGKKVNKLVYYKLA